MKKRFRILGGGLVYEKNRIVYAPYVYKGEIHVFNRDSDSWVLESKIESTPPSIVPSESKNRQTEGYSSFNAVKGQFFGRINAYDGGIFKENDDSIVHFYFERTEENSSVNRGLYVQKFDSELKLLGANKIKNFKEGEVHPISGSIYFKDQNDNYYLLRGERGSEKIDVFKVVME